MNASHLFSHYVPLSPLRLRKEVADSNLYECQPPLFQAKAPPFLLLIHVPVSHLFFQSLPGLMHPT
jgi:hypothetical protein